MKTGIVLSLPLALCLTLISPLAVAEDGPHDKAIQARQALMQLYGFNLGILNAMAKGKVDYDAEAASIAASNLLASVSMDQSAMWPQGSDSDTDGNRENRALPEIWTTYPKIAEAGKAMHEAATALNAAAGGGLDSLKGAMKDAGGACKGCHDDYRMKKN